MVANSMQKKSLIVTNPKLASEWHPANNGMFVPADVTAGSDKKVWWKCPKDSDHEWQATIASRNKGAGCPYCSGNKASKSNSLATLNPELAKQWHPTKNGALTPYDVLISSGKKVWWKCPKGDDHEWQARVDARNRGNGCGVCSGKVVVRSNCLATLNPALAKEWHPSKNENLTPYDVIPGTHKKVWWQGKCGHEWQTTIGHRTRRGQGCPQCKGKRISQTKRLKRKSNGQLPLFSDNELY